jgi:hypothetical protein
MTINAMTTAHRNEYFRKLREHQRLTLESVTEQRDEVRADLEFSRGLFQLQEQQMDSLREQRDRLAEALRELCETLLKDKTRDITDLLNKAGDALAAVKG